jgi:intein/homing endonuclease
MAFLRGYLMGDGYFQTPSEQYQGSKLVSNTISRALVSDMVVLLQQLGIAPTLGFTKRSGTIVHIQGREVNVRNRYELKISGKYNLDKLVSIVGPIPNQTRSQRRAISFPHTEDMMFIPIKKIEVLEGEFRVCDIQVADTNRFYAGVGGILVHNCGIQYSIPSDTRRLPLKFKMGNWKEFCHVPPFDGSVCQVCYYEQYNLSIKNMIEPIEHERFV